ncbi:MAG: aminotransferase class I/II-fold pyridoxal phosphate-dependent enzyme [Pseudomonadota bacterium]
MPPRKDAAELLKDYPYDRLEPMLGVTRAGREPVLLHVGEPKFAPPSIVQSVIAGHTDSWSRYPNVRGTEDLREAIAGWICRRYAIPPTTVDPARSVLPVAGSKEGLAFAITAAVMRKAARLPDGVRPVVFIPNPLYHAMFGAALMAGADPVTVPLTAAGGFKPDLTQCVPEDLSRAAAFVACTPNNPTASVMASAEIEALVGFAREHDFIAIFDEAYSEIYFDAPPPGGLGVAYSAFGDFRNVVASNSLSKRSGVPGLRGGFLAGDPEFVGTDIYLARAYAGPQIPLPLQDAQAALWNDEDHVDAYRATYRHLKTIADDHFAGLPGYAAPEASFFVWLDVGDGAAAARTLWQTEAIKVLPGDIMSRPEPDGTRPGAAYIRLPLVYDPDIMAEAFARVAATLAASRAA